MDYNFQPKNEGGKYTGLAIVAALHVIVGYLAVSGLGKKAFEIVKKPLEAVVIQEVKLPPPPPPPPKKIEPPKPQAPKVQAPPPPPYVPPPEVTPPPSAAPAIQSVQTPPPTPFKIEPPPPPPAPPAPPAAPTKTDIGVVCPTMVKPEMPRKALQDGSSGVVKAQVLVHGGVVREVTILSGPRIFHAAVRAAMMQYKCVAGDGDVLATQEFQFTAGE